MNGTIDASPTVVYGVDPLCGWCFAIGDELRRARNTLRGEVRWEVALGGLVVGDRVRPVREDANYLRAGLQAVERASGRRPGAAYWQRVVESGTWISDSEPACRAVVAARDIAGDDAAVSVAHLLCDGLYLDGRIPDDPQHVAAVGDAAGIGGQALLERWDSEVGRQEVQREFERARGLGVTTYPSLFVRRADSPPAPVVAGFAPAEAIVARVRQAIADLPQRDLRPRSDGVSSGLLP